MSQIKNKVVGKEESLNWLVLAIILLPNLIISLNTYMLQVALPQIQLDVGATFSQAQYILSAYSLGLSALLIIGGKLGDLFGQKRLLMIGIIGFLIASILGALTSNPAVLIFIRLIQGGFAACIQPQVLVLMRQEFKEEDQPLVFGIYGVVIGLGFTFGLMFGGIIMSANFMGLGWRNIFLFNIPCCLLILLGMKSLKGGTKVINLAKTPKFDWWSVVLLVPSILLVINSLYRIQTGVFYKELFIIVLGSVGIALFFKIEVNRKNQNKPVVVDMTLFKNTYYNRGLITVFFTYMAMFSLFFIITYYSQYGLKKTVGETSLIFLTLGVGFILSSLLSSRLVAVLNDRLLLIGCLGMILTLLVLSFSILIIPNLLSLRNAVLLFLYGSFLGATTTPLVGIILQKVSFKTLGIGGAFINTVMYLSNVIGVCVIGALFQYFLTNSLDRALLQDYQRAFSLSLWIISCYLVVSAIGFIRMLTKNKIG
ncbi:MFS transporter [Vagococcus fessus]|uniref:Major facilitator superfamily (MFS) profile domain-containing protein n=1 Tax=Vagococcus fessus TaxID=120370 RepID=A0A430A7A4_9ENTE|nr:MFS transporter [Vagococcus fessus]RSU02990.1 hypothetical protein CBF31_04490 [Vagococcus fessus]